MNHQVIMVIKGLLRHYVVDVDGNERTMLFVSEKQTTGTIESIFYNQSAIEHIEALEPSIIMTFDDRKAEKLAKKSTGLLMLRNKTLKKSLFEAVHRLREYILLTPEQRFKKFCEECPKLEQRIKQKYLASYLGMTETSLSRMRSRISRARGSKLS